MLRWWLAAVALTGCSTVLGLGDPKPASDAGGASCAIGDYDLCANQAANGPLDFTADTMINTDRDCDLVLYQPGMVSACVLYATTIHVGAGTTVTATGTRPLVLAAQSSITIDGTIDVGGHTIDAYNTRPGADSNDPACTFKQMATYGTNGAGGGAGGTFGGKGGDGGNGDAGSPGLASDVGAPPTFPRGGCGGSSAFGTRSEGGGGLWMTAGASISASPSARLLAGGTGGTAGGDAGLGGPASGGGSGGLIHLGAPSIAIAGLIEANGGGGGGGQGGTSVGMAGADASPSTTAAAGGIGGGGGGTQSGGGNGGKGSADTTLAGSPGTNSALVQNACGGGGGGGAGIIQLVGGSVSTAGATITPPAQ